MKNEMSEAFINADFWSHDDTAETLECRCWFDALNRVLSEHDGDEPLRAVTLYAYRRAKVELPHELMNGKSLASHVLELLGGETNDEVGLWNTGETGGHELFDVAGIDELGRASQSLVNVIVSQARPWTCEKVAEHHFSASDMELHREWAIRNGMLEVKK